MTGLPLRCARCQQPIAPGEEQEVPVEQATASSLLWVHRGPCPE
jgi:hypothetical protein